VKNVIVFPVPLENQAVRDLFKPFVKRFCESMRQFPAGKNYELAVVLNGNVDADSAKEDFHGLNPVFYEYSGSGYDIGSFQYYASICEPCFMVCCVTRVYAHRAGWLDKLVSARDFFGRGLYGTSASQESGKLHVCCRCYAFDSEDFKRYPHAITSRDQGVFFECGDGCLLGFFNDLALPVKVVYWDRVEAVGDTREWQNANNIFRDGDQSNVLVHDRHTDYYRDASTEEKKRLERECFGQ
jgi:hypothetical protein